MLDELTWFALVLKGSSSVLVHSLDGGEERALVIRPLPRGSCFSVHSKKIGVFTRCMALSGHCRGPCETARPVTREPVRAAVVQSVSLI